MGNPGGNAMQNVEPWELQEGQYISRSLSVLSRSQKMAILMTLGLITGVEFAHRVSVNVLLPDMQGNVAADSDQISWVVILYNMGFLCSMPLAAWMTRVIGARKHLLINIGIYLTGAMGCALSSHSLELLLISRAIMGFGGGAFLVRMVILLGLMFPGASRLVPVMWIYAILFSIAIVYPTAVGWIDDHSHWNYAFLLDFPFLILGAVLVWKLIPPGHLFRRPRESSVDFRGAFLLIASMICLQTALSRGERDMWFDTTWIAVALAVALVCFVGFLWTETRPDNTEPVLHVRMIWRQAYLRASLSVVLIVGAMLGAGLYVLPQYLRGVQDYSATQTGAFISVYVAGICAGCYLALRALFRFGGPITTAVGLFMMSSMCALLIYVWTPTTPTFVLAPAIFFQGFSLGPILLGGANIATGAAALPDLNDIATTFFFSRQLGNVFGVTAATILFDHRMTFHSSRLLDVANRLDPIVRSTLAQYASLIHRNGGAGSNPMLGALQIFQANVITQSKLLSYIDIYFGLALLGVVGIVLLAISRVKNKLGPTHFHLW